ncbi:unnamed protein product [Prorocentrum cordatum]|uniref:Uncharacterized protein n=1 Tax=Prorocentrum cordatum TaxID=2364126 RepID=A0ABN9S434_9DINO|nr:unnamed protein product [Polarella glacialis]
MAGQHTTGMLSPRAMSQGEEAAPVENGTGKAAHPESSGLSSARTQCSAPDLLLLDFSDGEDAVAHEKSWGCTAPPRDGSEPAPFRAALREAVPLGDRRPSRRGGPAVPAPGGAPLKRLRSEAFWEQRAAAARRPRCSPWEPGARQRRPCLEAESLAPAAGRQ